MKKRYKIHLVAGARPNFMKIGPLYHVLKARTWAIPLIVHTGQHYDPQMSADFFSDLALPAPAYHLGVGSGSHAEQTARIMLAYEEICLKDTPDLVVVVGDVNSTMACALVSVKLQIPTAHLEAGLRSFDLTMPEEINRMVTDIICDILWTPSEDADQNLRRAGIEEAKIVRVGNIMIDALEMQRPQIEKRKYHERLHLSYGHYGVATIHRPNNVDMPQALENIIDALGQVSKHWPLVFPLHPRTRQRLAEFKLQSLADSYPGLRLIPPIPYLEFMSLILGAKLVITDSGGIQEETTYLGIPCFTLRPNTERPITISQGTNHLSTSARLWHDIEEALANKTKHHARPELWDGHTAERVASSIETFLQSR